MVGRFILPRLNGEASWIAVCYRRTYVRSAKTVSCFYGLFYFYRLIFRQLISALS